MGEEYARRRVTQARQGGIREDGIREMADAGDAVITTAISPKAENHGDR